LGLGLTLAHRVALAHGGKIALVSEVGRGTAVRVELPLG
jgi:signal transduction histidine kinase